MTQPEIIRIRSEDANFQHIETLRRNRVKRNHAREFFVEGVRPITQAVKNRWTINALVYTREKRLSDWAMGVIRQDTAKRQYELPLRLMEKLSDKEDPSELIALLAMPPDDLNRIPVREDLLVMLLDRPANPGNIGTIIRSCEALGAHGLIISGHAADLYDPETVRATTGSFFSLPCVRIQSQNDLLPWLEAVKRRVIGLRVVGTSAHAKTPIQRHDFTAPTLLLVGNETNGLSEAWQTLSDEMVTIPQVGSATSLNIASAASILLYEVARQRRK